MTRAIRPASGLRGRGKWAMTALLLPAMLIALVACGGEQAPPPANTPVAAEPAAATVLPPTPVPSERLTPTVAPEPTPAASLAETPEPVATATTMPTAVRIQKATPKPVATPTTMPTAVPIQTATPTPAPVPTAMPEPSPTPTATPAPAHTPTPTPTATPASTTTPAPTATQSPPPTLAPTAAPTSNPAATPAVRPSVAGYSPLLARAASTLPAKYDFVSDGLNPAEIKLLDVADSRLFANPAFLESGFSPDMWPSGLRNYLEEVGAKSGLAEDNPLTDSELRVASAQAIVLMMRGIDVQVKANGEHIISWEVDSLDRILDDLEIYPGECVHCYGKTGYDTREEVNGNYLPSIVREGHMHREKLKTLAYLPDADGEGLLIRSFMDNGPEEIDLLHKRRLNRRSFTPLATGSFAYENVSFMSQIELPDGTLVSYPTMAFGMAGNTKDHREAVENVFDYMRKKLTHFTGDLDDFADLYRPYASTPYSPELGWIVYVGEAGSPSAAGAITGLLRPLGFQAEQFATPRNNMNAGSVQIHQNTYYYNGNDPMGRNPRTGELLPICSFFRTLEQVDNQEYDWNCDK